MNELKEYVSVTVSETVLRVVASINRWLVVSSSKRVFDTDLPSWDWEEGN